MLCYTPAKKLQHHNTNAMRSRLERLSNIVHHVGTDKFMDGGLVDAAVVCMGGGLGEAVHRHIIMSRM